MAKCIRDSYCWRFCKSPAGQYNEYILPELNFEKVIRTSVKTIQANLTNKELLHPSNFYDIKMLCALFLIFADKIGHQINK